MTPPDPLPRLIGIVSAITPHELRWAIGGQADLHRDLGLDQIDRMTLACELDEAFGIEVPDADVHAWSTVADLARTVARLTGADPRHLLPLEPGETA